MSVNSMEHLSFEPSVSVVRLGWLNQRVTTALRLAPATALRLALLPQILGLACVIAAVVLRAQASSSTLAAALVALGAGFLIVGLGLSWGRPWVMRVDDNGYRLRFVRGAGAAAGSWSEVSEAVTAEVRGARCLVLNRRDGTRTVIPVDLLDLDSSEVVELVRGYLNRRQLGGAGEPAGTD